ncbi:hypothetical protein FB45DRAFT_997729 [Roridomyces roridus]|uniref:Uncharacterized protein n=1 Tax=Roridomyces roridus TaxID=1738132 RepID=A0AAD7CKI9_9AGAR|nr:hypothetical protein FB45DRAFT_997729 [Roridomyces roridus]
MHTLPVPLCTHQRTQRLPADISTSSTSTPPAFSLHLANGATFLLFPGMPNLCVVHLPSVQEGRGEGWARESMKGGKSGEVRLKRESEEMCVGGESGVASVAGESGVGGVHQVQEQTGGEGAEGGREARARARDGLKDRRDLPGGGNRRCDEARWRDEEITRGRAFIFLSKAGKLERELEEACEGLKQHSEQCWTFLSEGRIN